MCSFESNFFQHDEIISTSKLPFHNPLVVKCYNVFIIFSLDYENRPLTKLSLQIVLNIYFIYPKHMTRCTLCRDEWL